jgi:hypothetical protein
MVGQRQLGLASECGLLVPMARTSFLLRQQMAMILTMALRQMGEVEASLGQGLAALQAGMMMMVLHPKCQQGAQLQGAMGLLGMGREVAVEERVQWLGACRQMAQRMQAPQAV